MMVKVRESSVNTPGQVIESTGELVLVEVLDNELPAGVQFVYSEKGVRVIGAPSVADFCLEISKAARFGALLHFVIGDLLLAMQCIYGETYAQAASLTGYAPGTITNDVSIAKRVPPEVRRLDACTYAHHQAVASLPVEYQKAVLDMAADGAWSTAETNAYVQLVKRANALPELDGLPELPPPVEEFTAIADHARVEGGRIVLFIEAGSQEGHLPEGRCKFKVKPIEERVIQSSPQD